MCPPQLSSARSARQQIALMDPLGLHRAEVMRVCRVVGRREANRVAFDEDGSDFFDTADVVEWIACDSEEVGVLAD